MVGEWRATTVRQLVDEGILERPIDGNHGDIHPKTGDFVKRGIPFIMASDLVGGRVDTTHCAFISDKQARSLRKGFALPGDVLISHKATMGRTALVEHLNVPFLMLTPQVTYYRVKDPSRLVARYLKLYFDSPEFQALFETWGQKGSTRAYLGITAQLDLPIVLPPTDEQRAIAHILGTLDDKIELNRRMIETLEAMARAVFKSWFVNFDPVRAKAEGCDPGLHQPLADLFPDSFEDSELGEIPDGWQVRKVSSVIDFVRGVEPGRSACNEEGRGLPFIRVGDVTGKRTSKLFIDSVLEPRCRLGDIMLALDGTPGALAVDMNGVFSSGIRKLVPKPETDLSPLYVWSLALSDRFQETVREHARGTTIQHAGGAVEYLRDIYPGPGVMGAYSTLTAPIWERILRLHSETETLTSLRNTILPKLISGDLRVQNPARFLGSGR